MNKTAAGFVLVAGLILGFASLPFSSGAVFGTDIQNDTANKIAQVIGIAGVLGGAAAFFFGAMFFSRK